MKEEKQNGVVINEKSMEILVAKFIPTSQYFERSFDMLQEQLKENKEELRDFKQSVDKRFEQVERRFEQVDKKIDDFKSDVNKRFEQVDKKFELVNDSIIKLTFKIEELTKAQEVTIRDYIIERDRHYDAKFANLRMFNIAIISLVAGVILKMAGIINF
ncbi:MAG: hypothetical protein L3J44_02940 [Campylobacteraceae bacterium]|nr:hypothetical protein [Campylobacteraceae bacterium]